MQDDVVALFAYDRWANTKVLDSCRKLTAEQYVAEPVPGWSSVRSTISHIALESRMVIETRPEKSTISFSREFAGKCAKSRGKSMAKVVAVCGRQEPAICNGTHTSFRR